jgi:probable HAF family extracellular repeat protein
LTELDTPDGERSLARAIDASGRVAGVRSRNRVQTVGTSWESESSIDFGPYDGGNHTWATALGPNGTVFGTGRMPLGFGRPKFSWVSWEDIAPTPLLYMPQFVNSVTWDVNSSSWAVGHTMTFDQFGQDAVRRGYLINVDSNLNEPTLIPTLGGWANWANAVTDAFVVVGGSFVSNGPIRAFRWSAVEGAAPIGGLGTGVSEALDINAAGQIVGWYNDDSGARRAFVWQAGTMTDLGTLGGAHADATSINAGGMIVGQSWTDAGAAVGFVHDGQHMHNLMHRTANLQNGWVLSRAEGINVHGSIAGWGTRIEKGARVTRAFKLDPVCPIDWNADGQFDFADVLAYLDDYHAADPGADLNNDGLADFFDILDYVGAVSTGCP